MLSFPSSREVEKLTEPGKQHPEIQTNMGKMQQTKSCFAQNSSFFDLPDLNSTSSDHAEYVLSGAINTVCRNHSCLLNHQIKKSGWGGAIRKSYKKEICIRHDCLVACQDGLRSFAVWKASGHTIPLPKLHRKHPHTLKPQTGHMMGPFAQAPCRQQAGKCTDGISGCLLRRPTSPELPGPCSAAGPHWNREGRAAHFCITQRVSKIPGFRALMTVFNCLKFTLSKDLFTFVQLAL